MFLIGLINSFIIRIIKWPKAHLIIDLRIGERNRNVSSLVGTVVL